MHAHTVCRDPRLASLSAEELAAKRRVGRSGYGTAAGPTVGYTVSTIAQTCEKCGKEKSDGL